jgi:hypothetical protein
MKSFIIAALLLFGVETQAQYRYFFSEIEYQEHRANHYANLSVDGYLFTQRLEDGFDEWLENHPDGYEVYCDPCNMEIGNKNAIRQNYAIPPHTKWTPISLSLVDTIKCVMLISEPGGPAKYQNGYEVRRGWSHLKYLDANKAEIKGFVWMSQKIEW